MVHSGFQPTASVFEVASIVSRAFFTAILRAITYPFRHNRASNFLRDVGFASLRKVVTIARIPFFRRVAENTYEGYRTYCKKQKLAPRSQILDDIDGTDDGYGNSLCAVGHWIGEPDADVVVLCIHGGAFVLPCPPGDFAYHHHMVKTRNQAHSEGKGKSVAALILEYTTAPEDVYPAQLKQAAALLSHLITVDERSPSSIIIRGESAGGGLLMSLLAHLLHPHPDVQPVPLSEPLGGVILNSPWVSFDTSYASYTINEEKDMLSQEFLRWSSALYLDSRVTGDWYNEPAAAEASWWQGMHRVVSNVLILAGGDELFVDAIKDFGTKFAAGWQAGGGDQERLKVVVSPKEAHCEALLDFAHSTGTSSNGGKAIEAFLSSRLK